MATSINGRTAALLEPAGAERRRLVERRDTSACPIEDVSVRETDDGLVIQVELTTGPLELRVPKAATAPRHRRRIAFCNPDATPC